MVSFYPGQLLPPFPFLPPRSFAPCNFDWSLTKAFSCCLGSPHQPLRLQLRWTAKGSLARLPSPGELLVNLTATLVAPLLSLLGSLFFFMYYWLSC
jgi:hypothetical protein